MLEDFSVVALAATGAAALATAAAADTPQAVERLRAAARLQCTLQWQPPKLPRHVARGRGDV